MEPIELKKANGTYRPYKDGKYHPSPDLCDELPHPPDDLNDHGQHEWNRVVVELDKMKMLSSIDLGALYLLCQQYGKAVEIHEMVQDSYGSWFEYLNTEELNSQTDMLSKEYNKAIEYYFKHLGLFAITPAERAKIKLTASETKEVKTIDMFKPA